MAENDVLEVYDLDESLADAEKPPELPNGTYLAEVQAVSDAVSSSGNPYWPVQFRIQASECPPEIADAYPDGVLLTYNRITKPRPGDARAKYNLKQFYQALGLDTNISQVDPTDWIGREARVIVKQQAYQGEMRAGISGIAAGEGAEEAQASGKGKAAARRGSRR